MVDNTASENMYKALKDDPKAIIAWCEEEIEQYKNLIKLVKKEMNANN